MGAEINAAARSGGNVTGVRGAKGPVGAGSRGYSLFNAKAEVQEVVGRDRERNRSSRAYPSLPFRLPSKYPGIDAAMLKLSRTDRAGTLDERTIDRTHIDW